MAESPDTRTRSVYVADILREWQQLAATQFKADTAAARNARLTKAEVERAPADRVNQVTDFDTSVTLGLLAERTRQLVQVCEQRGIDTDPLSKLIGILFRPADFAAHCAALEAAWKAVESLSESPALPPSEPQPVVQLRGIAQRPIVNGVEVEPLSEPRYLVVQALLDAGPDGLSKPDLEKVKGDAIAYLRELSQDPEWKGSIIMAGRAWGRYGITYR